MTSGLLVSLKKGCDLKIGNLNPLEKFEGLDLLSKYGFDFGWYTFGDNIHVILKCVKEGESQIYLAENKLEVESVINKLISEAVRDFGFDEKTQREIYEKLRKHDCCYF
jgi:hypothetical protein